MKRLGLWVALGATGLSLEAQGKVGVCGFFEMAYRGEIRPKIETGVPFEIMGALFEENVLVNKKVVHVQFNLWDEIVTLKSEDRVIARASPKDAENVLCGSLEFEDPLKSGKKYTYRLLLNPLWGERLTRLQITAGGRRPGAAGIIGIDWKRLVQEMPSDKVLLQKELQE